MRKRGGIGGPEMRREIGQRLREARKRRRLIQADLAAALSVTAQQVQKYETGKCALPLAACIMLREAFGITLAELAPLRPDATVERLAETVESLGRLLEDVRRMK